MDQSQAILKEIQALRRLVDTLLEQKEKKTWVKSTTITAVTGWNNEKMRQMRVNGVIKWKKTGNGFFYILESVPEIFLKKATY